MISRIHLLSGRTPGAAPISFDTTPVTVFVGPNHSGKSLALREIHALCGHEAHRRSLRIVKGFDYSGLRQQDVDETIASIATGRRPGYVLQPGGLFVKAPGGGGWSGSVKQLESMLRDPAAGDVHESILTHYLQRETLMLGGEARVDLIKPQPAGTLTAAPESSLQVLFRDDNKRAELQRVVNEAFGTHLVIDPTDLGHLRLRLSSVPPESISQERSLNDEAIEFFRAAAPIEDSSDGVKAFVGIMTAIIAGDPRIVLIDEPETFLYPALATSLAREIVLSSMKANKRLFVATHSPHFVMGCVQSGVPVNIVRLTYRAGVATARVLRSTVLSKLMRNPLLRSTGLLNALFYESVVVTESDADRAFYDEINVRLLAHKPAWGIQHCLFLNAQNKQTVHQILSPLRELGITTAAVVDVDVVKDGGAAWTALLSGAYVPEPLHNALATLRAKVKTLFEASGRCMKRDGGIAILDGPEQETASSLFDQLQQYGVFVVRGGELESWLRALKASGHGPAWLVDIFSRMGDNPDLDGYVHPSAGDVWQFLATIREWLHNPSKRGIPS